MLRRYPFLNLAAAIVVVFLGTPLVARAQTPADAPAQAGPQNPAPAQPIPAPVYSVTVVGTAPLPGVDLPLEKIPAPVQTATGRATSSRAARSISPTS